MKMRSMIHRYFLMQDIAQTFSAMHAGEMSMFYFVLFFCRRRLVYPSKSCAVNNYLIETGLHSDFVSANFHGIWLVDVIQL